MALKESFQKMCKNFSKSFLGDRKLDIFFVQKNVQKSNPEKSFGKKCFCD